MPKTQNLILNKKIEYKIKKFYELIKNLYPIKKVILYGSYAKNNVDKNSDIDVGIVIDLPKTNDDIKITANLFHYASKIDPNIEPLCIFWNEYKNCEKASILAEIIRTAIEIE